MEEDEDDDDEKRDQADADADVEVKDVVMGAGDVPEEARSNMPTSTNTKARRPKLVSPFHIDVENVDC
jgi:hypothetical protein